MALVKQEYESRLKTCKRASNEEGVIASKQNTNKWIDDTNVVLNKAFERINVLECD